MKYTKQEQKIASEQATKKYRKRLDNRTFGQCVIKSKWFKLGVEQAVRNKQATRVLIGENIIYEIDAHDILINLIDLTFETKKRKNFAFIKALNKL